MALIAHRMMLPSRQRKSHSTQQSVATNKVGVLLVPSFADYCYDQDQYVLKQINLEQEVSACILSICLYLLIILSNKM